jgi:outer membrane protein
MKYVSALRILLGAGAVVIGVGPMRAASAADVATPIYRKSAPSSDWTVTVGVEGRVLPEFEGSDRYTFTPFPIFDIRRAGTPPSFHSPRDGFGFAILDTGKFRAGPAFKIRLPRDENDDEGLRGLGDVDWAVEAGGFAEYWIAPWLRARAELRQGFGGHKGLVADLTADVVVPVGPQWTLSGGPRATFATDAAVAPYFSITQPQSSASGLPVYDAKGGLYSYGAGGQVRYQWTPQWATYTFAEYARLSDGAGNSPLVTERGSRDQIQVGIGASYSFDIRAPW